RRIEDGHPSTIDMIDNGTVKLLINTENSNSNDDREGFKLRRHAIEHGIATITSLDTLLAVVECLEQDLHPSDLQPYEIRVFADIVAKTRNNCLPMNEMPSQNDMLRK
ncbi:MAG: carbamoyl-phosphate synthase large subunit, partial [Firmicutes bacterium]|nr:carbamoyl-phosphate synthase large subunit [Bacillota bacterium]